MPRQVGAFSFYKAIIPAFDYLINHLNCRYLETTSLANISASGFFPIPLSENYFFAPGTITHFSFSFH
jgi:hypothetical protein